VKVDSGGFSWAFRQAAARCRFHHPAAAASFASQKKAFPNDPEIQKLAR